MSEQLPSDEGQDFTDLSAFDSVGATTQRLSRNGIVAVAAGLVLACGVGVGFAYVNSSPSGDASFAAPGGSTSTPDTTSSPSSTKGAISFAGSGKDAFNNTVAPSTASTTAAGAVGSSSGTVGTTGSVTTSSTTTTKAASSGTGTSKSGGSKGTVTTPAAPVTPTPSRSTAPAWEQPQITYVGDYDGLTQTYSFEVGGYTKWYPLGQVLPGTSTVFKGSYSTPKKRAMTQDEMDKCNAGVTAAERAATDNCTTITEAIASALFGSTQGTDSGWIVTGDNALPAAAMGNALGTVRFIGYVEGKAYIIQVGREQFRVEVGQLVPGTTLTLRGMGADEVNRDDVVTFTGSDGTIYFTVVGAGEDAGVLF